MMHHNQMQKNKISTSLLRVIKAFLHIDKNARYCGTDQQLFSSEIHMIRAIKENEGIHITGLAKILRVTKGAVSQMMIKLEKKGFVNKERDRQNQSRLSIKLTQKGEIAYVNHLKFHDTFDDLINETLKNASEDNVVFLETFLLKLERRIESYEKIEMK